jgi:hypothetical protein
MEQRNGCRCWCLPRCLVLCMIAVLILAGDGERGYTDGPPGRARFNQPR